MRQAGDDKGAKDLYHILTNIRKGHLLAEDLQTLNNRAIGGGHPGAPTDLNDPRLHNAKFLVFRHSIIALLSRSEVPEMARRANKRLVKFYSDHAAVDGDGNTMNLPAALLKIARDKPMKGKNTRRYIG